MKNKKFINRIVSLIFVLLMILGSFSSAFAVSPDAANDFDGFKAAIKAGASAFVTEIDIKSFNISESTENYNKIKEIMFYEFPELFMYHGFTLTKTSGVYSKITPKYYISKTEYNNQLAICNEKIAYIKRNLDSSSLTDVQKVLLVHDRIAVMSEYDNSPASTRDAASSHMNGVLVNGKSVCEGYAATYKYILNSIGVKCGTVTSDTLKHTWNIVTVNGKQYHVDVTWDDPNNGGELYGYVSHENLLRSTNGIKSTGHSAGDFNTAPVDTTFDNYYWQDSNTEIQFVNGKIYFIDSVNKTLCEVSPSNEKKVIKNINYDWGFEELMPNGKKSSSYSMLSSDGGCLYYNTPTEIVEYNPSTGNTSTVYAPSLSGGNKIFGFKNVQGTLCLDINDNPGVTAAIRASKGIKYALNSYSITYDANGGSNAPAVQIKTKGESVKLSTQVPVRTGYIFLGWSDSASATTAKYAKGATYTADGNITLYAVWKYDESVKPTLTIRNYTAERSESYKASFTFHAEFNVLPTGAYIEWTITDSNGLTEKRTGNDLTINKATGGFTVKCEMIRDGSVVASSPEEKVNIDSGFFAMLIAFFRNLFNSLPKIDQ